ncbi:MAG: AsnC family protein [Clostridiales bacterium]|nr:AsnC family protein [Clostridiales bacterium]
MENMNNAAAIISEWNGMNAREQIRFITACIFKIIKAQPAGTLYEINEIVNEAWLRITDNMTADKLNAINERRAAQGKATTTLAGIVFRAARASIAAISYSDKKHAAASVRTVKSEGGEEADYIDTMTAIKNDTEAAAILSVDLQRFITSRDSTDQQIIYGLMEKRTERELAAVAGISAPAVHKRIVKMRAALAEII